MTRLKWAALAILLSMSTAPCIAQDAPKPFQAFDRVIEKVTGNNGYEELVMAADLTTANAAFNEMQQLPAPGPTLAIIRKTLEQPDLVRAHALLKLGLSKPVGTPRSKIDDETVLPELAGFRNLARMMGYQLYVDFADGRISRAIDTLRDCLRFGYVVQTDSLVSGLVGVAVDAIAIRPIDEHLEQLSAGDCDHLLTVVREWLRLPDPSTGILNSERLAIANLLRKYRSNPAKLIEQISADPQSEEYKKSTAMLAMFNQNPGSVGTVFDQAGAKMSAHFDRLMAEQKKAPWERQELPKMEDDSPAGRLCGMLGDSTLGSMVLDKYAYEQARVQMLGVYAAIRRFRWENRMLPASLAILNLGGLAIDPFTGKQFNYKPINDKDFELGSAGPMDRAKDAPTAGQRTPVFVPARKQPQG